MSLSPLRPQLMSTMLCSKQSRTMASGLVLPVVQMVILLSFEPTAMTVKCCPALSAPLRV